MVCEVGSEWSVEVEGAAEVRVKFRVEVGRPRSRLGYAAGRRNGRENPGLRVDPGAADWRFLAHGPRTPPTARPRLQRLYALQTCVPTLSPLLAPRTHRRRHWTRGPIASASGSDVMLLWRRLVLLRWARG